MRVGSADLKALELGTQYLKNRPQKEKKTDQTSRNFEFKAGKNRQACLR